MFIISRMKKITVILFLSSLAVLTIASTAGIKYSEKTNSNPTINLLDEGLSVQQNPELKAQELKSPNGQIIFSLQMKSGYPSYSITYKGKKLVDESKLSLNFAETGEFGKNINLTKTIFRELNETYDLVVGKNKT